MKNITLIIALVLLGGLSSTAQNKATKKADKHFAKFEFVEAVEAYNKLVEKGSGDAYVYGRLAEANYNIFNTVEAERWYAKALESSSDPEMTYRYSQMLKANGKYEASNVAMQKFATMHPEDSRAIAFNANPDYIRRILKKGNKLTVENLDINSPAADFGATIQDGKLYLTSARNDSRKDYGWNEEPFLDIYEYTVGLDGTYQEETLLSKDINTKHHEGVVSFSLDGKTMYFSRESFYEDIYEKDSVSNTKFSVLHIYKATKSGDEWKNVEALSINDENHSIKNPSVSKDGKTLYFASDMPGGQGGFDIYKAPINNDGQVGEPVNLGKEVNTGGQEMFPYSSHDNTLYFSSNGHLGLGGLDVFFISENNGKMSPLRNIGAPVNSNSDDFAFNMDESGDGFVSSNRAGGKGGDDVYAVKKIQPICDVEMIVHVENSETGESIANATVTLSDESGSLIASETTNAEGLVTFNVECDKNTNLVVGAEEYENNTADVSGTKEEQVEVEVKLDPVKKIIVADRIVLEPIYFDYDKSNITEQGAFELDKLIQIMNNYPDMVINAKSHTDSRGKDKYNKDLSSRRAKSTVEYVISKGIDSSRISGVGMGESEPLSDCGDDCSEEQHQLNRRSEFIIVSGGPEGNQ